MKKPEKKRNNVKYPALIPKYNPKVRQDLIDYDYLDKLTEEEKAWLNKFSEEYINARFNGDDTDIDKTPEGRKASYDRNNARNRCVYNQLKVRRGNDGLIPYDQEIVESVEKKIIGVDNISIEDAYIDYIDYNDVKNALKEYLDYMSEFTEADG